jgi:hypothetical protein
MPAIIPWIGVDLDGTLAHYGEWGGSTVIGAPIPKMVERVRMWLANGHVVKVFTARVACGENEPPQESEAARAAIQDWCLRNIGVALPVTNKKDFGMVSLWDDRAVQVLKNTGLALVVDG